MSENFSNWNWVVLVLYLGSVFAIGIKARKHQKSSEDFFLAGPLHGLPAPGPQHVHDAL